MAFPAEFRGELEPGRDYLIVDDHVGMGGSIAALRSFIEEGGGKVLAATTLTQSRASDHIALTDDTLTEPRAKHGQALEDLWQERFGHGPEGLTEPQAGILVYGSKTRDIAAISEGLDDLGYLTTRSREPPGIHLKMDPIEDDRFVRGYLADLATVVEDVRAGVRRSTGRESAYF